MRAADLAPLRAFDPEWVDRLAAFEPPPEGLLLPSLDEAPALLDRLGVLPQDAAALLEHWPSAGWPPHFTWALAHVYALVHADLGGYVWLSPGPVLPEQLGPAANLLYWYAYLALTAPARGYHLEHRIPDEVSWTTLAELGRDIEDDRELGGFDRHATVGWLTLHVRGGIYELGRLQFQRHSAPPNIRAASGSDWALSVHIPPLGPLTPEACDASLDRARELFARCFPEEPYGAAFCDSWLLDPQLAEYLPEDSNIVRFQRRFTLTDDTSQGRADVLRFVFRVPRDTPIETLPRRTKLERALAEHLEAGREWHVRRGWFAL